MTVDQAHEKQVSTALRDAGGDAAAAPKAPLMPRPVVTPDASALRPSEGEAREAEAKKQEEAAARRQDESGFSTKDRPDQRLARSREGRGDEGRDRDRAATEKGAERGREAKARQAKAGTTTPRQAARSDSGSSAARGDSGSQGTPAGTAGQFEGW